MIFAFRQLIVERLQARRARLITPDHARERAQRGAAYLDEVAPGWFEDVDPWSLNLADGRACVLGQLHGSFAIGLGRAGIFSLSSAPRASFSPVDLGFHCVQGVSEELQEQDHSNLTSAWRREVGGRRRASDRPSRRGLGSMYRSRRIVLQVQSSSEEIGMLRLF